jgi:hypothetical protein
MHIELEVAELDRGAVNSNTHGPLPGGSLVGDTFLDNHTECDILIGAIELKALSLEEVAHYSFQRAHAFI